MIWFSSDFHFGHANVIKHCNRPFSSVEEMNEALVDNWNSRVSKTDEAWILGDFSFLPIDETLSILNRMNGVKHFVKGNHDRVLKGYEHVFQSFQDYRELKWNKKKYILSHYPFFSWNGAHRGSVHLHGHCHGTVNWANEDTTRLDVGVDVHNYTPISIEEVEAIMETKLYKAVDHHQVSVKAKKSNVHTTHCCKRHGCKYGDSDCPVEMGLLVQEYPCENCSVKEF